MTRELIRRILFAAIWVLFFGSWIVRDALAHRYGWVLLWSVPLLIAIGGLGLTVRDAWRVQGS